MIDILSLVELMVKSIVGEYKMISRNYITYITNKYISNLSPLPMTSPCIQLEMMEIAAPSEKYAPIKQKPASK
jgi:hypothetical protein